MSSAETQQKKTQSMQESSQVASNPLTALLAERSLEKWKWKVEQLVKENLLESAVRSVVISLLKQASSDRSAFTREACSVLLSAVESHPNRMEAEALLLRDILFYMQNEQDEVSLQRLQNSVPSTADAESPRADEKYVGVCTRLVLAALDADQLSLAETLCRRGVLPLKIILRSLKGSASATKFLRVHAEVLDRRGKYLEAGRQYLEVFKRDPKDVLALKHAAVCTLLANPGPRRSRILALIEEDEQALSLGSLCEVLNTVLQSRLLRRDDVEVFTQYVLPHHLTPVYARYSSLLLAVVQHNLLVVSQLYYNISLADLGYLVNLNTDDVEEIAAWMVTEERLRASLDQVERFIYFYPADHAALLEQWDDGIAQACCAAVHVAERICHSHPVMSKYLHLESVPLKESQSQQNDGGSPR